ncbi:MAG: potassium-transporting ATPase subunit KdpB [Verrucomicrobiia bacterium]|jgi:K+-transporting ATPase ATPase B chain
MNNVANTQEPKTAKKVASVTVKPIGELQLPSGFSPHHKRQKVLLTGEAVGEALKQAFVMLRPDIQWKNPVMFVVEVGAILTLFYVVQALFGHSASLAPVSYFIALDAWLFATVLFANFATALAEVRGKAQAESLRKARHDTVANRVTATGIEKVSSSVLKQGDRVVVQEGETIPGDGEIIEGIASVDESAITGESAPVIRESGGDRSGVTGGTVVLSDRIVVKITSSSGDSFLERMIRLVEGAIRQRTPNEIALTMALSAFTLIFLIVVIPLWPMAWNAEQYMMGYMGITDPLHSLGTDIPTLIALLVCLIPTTIGALLAAIGIAGMDRALQNNIIAKSGKAVELAGDIDVVLLDKTGTITMGNRHATKFIPYGTYTTEDVGRLAALASAADQTPEGKSIVKLFEEQDRVPVNQPHGQTPLPRGAVPVPFTAQTRMSGVDLPDGRHIRKGAADAIIKFVTGNGGSMPADLKSQVDSVASKGATPLVVCEDQKIVGIVVLEDILKPAMKDRFARLRKMGLRTVMITGDNPLTAATIAANAGVDDFIAQATPESKLAYLRKEQAEGKLVAMMGDGTNDAPALAQADVALAMNAGTQAAKEAANMVDLDSDPTKLIEVVEIGKQLLMTRGALTTFSIANDVAKYFAIIPALFAGTLPWLKAIDIMHLHSPTSAILSAVIFNALIIPALIPVALKGVNYQPLGADALLRKNLFVWGLGGVIIPFIGIKLIDVAMVGMHMAS